MIFTTLYALSFAALAVAQSSSTTVSIILPNADTMSSLVGSIAGSDASATTYVIGCASTTSAPAAAASTGANSSNLVYADPQNGCGFDQSQTITQGFSTFHWIFSESQIGAAITVDCALSGTTQAVCTETATSSALTAAAASGSGLDSGIPPLSTATLSGSSFPSYQTVLITAGLSNLKASGASSTGPPSSTSTGSASSGGPTTKPSGGSATTSSSGAMVIEPALAMGATGMLAVGLLAFAL